MPDRLIAAPRMVAAGTRPAALDDRIVGGHDRLGSTVPSGIPRRAAADRDRARATRAAWPTGAGSRSRSRRPTRARTPRAWSRGSPTTAARRRTGATSSRGRWSSTTATGRRRSRAAQAYYVAPGHKITFETDCEALEFTPTDALEQTLEAARRNFAAGATLELERRSPSSTTSASRSSGSRGARSAGSRSATTSS